MKSTMQYAWHRKAGAFVAGSLLISTQAPALADGWAVHVPTATSVPVNHFSHSMAGGSQPNNAARSWGFHSQALSGAVQQHQAFSAATQSTTVQHAGFGHRANAWQGQQFLTNINTMRGNFNHLPGNLHNLANFGGSGLDLDLTSKNPSVVLGSNLFKGVDSVTISMGGKTEVFTAGAHVTAAEYVAIRQVLAGTTQTLTLNSDGAAIGGSFNMNASAPSHIADLVIPAGVTAFDYALGSKGPIISGDILNYGTIYGVGIKGQSHTVNINAQDITNEAGGLISTKLPASLLAALGGAMTGVNLSLNAVDDFSNSGKIVSSGSLSITSLTGSIFNGAFSAASAVSTNVPTLQANGSINLVTGSGNVTNAGMIASSVGNINISTTAISNNINVCATGGTFQASKGNINIRDASYTGSANINLNGGDYLSRNLNLYSGTGVISGTVGELTGTLNTAAAADHLQVATSILKLGNNIISGDPTFVNTVGDIQIVGKNEFGEDVAIIAAKKITAAVDGQIVASGHNVTLVSGANVTAGSPDTGTVQGNSTSPPTVNGNATTNVTIDPTAPLDFANNIDLSASKIANIIDTSSTTGNAGNITLVAYNGNIHLPTTSTINATAVGNKTGGSVTMIAGSDELNAIQIGGIKTSGGSVGGQGGSISLYTSTPTTSDGKPITYDPTGAVTTGNKFVATAVTNDATMSINGDLLTAPLGQSGVAAGSAGGNAGAITLASGGGVTAKNILAFGGGGAGGNATTMTGGAGGAGAAINISAYNGGINISGQVNSSGGGGGGAGSDEITGAAGGLGGAAGAITISEAGTKIAAPLLISGGIFASQGGNGGSSDATGVGGGGASYGGGGGGGASATYGGAAGAGYFGGGGAISNSAGNGGAFTGGSAGGVGAQKGGLSAGGNGIGDTSTSTKSLGGTISGPQQGGQGAGSGIAGDNIPQTAGGGDITIVGVDLTKVGGTIAGKDISITAPIGITFAGDVVGSSSVSVTVNSGFVFQGVAGSNILTPTLNLNVGSTSPVNIGSSGIPLSTNAATVTLTGKASGIWMNNTATSTLFDSSGLTTISSLDIEMSAKNASLDIAALPAGMSSLILNVGSDTVNGGTINFQKSNLILADGGLAKLTANNISWNQSGTSPLAVVTDSATGAGGTIVITANKIAGTTSFGIGNSAGNISLSAKGNTGNGGSISLVSPGAALTVDSNFLQVGITGTPTAAKGGNIVLNASTIANVTPGASLNLNANGVGTGNGGTISITTNTASSQSLGTTAGAISLSAVNGGTSGFTQTGGSVTFINLGTGLLTVDPTALKVSIAAGASNVNNGSITLKSGKIENSTGGTPLVLNLDGLNAGNGGKISVTQTNAGLPTVTLGPTGDFALSAQGGIAGGNGGSVTFSTQGNLLLTTDSSGNVIGPGLSASVGPQFTTGNGGLLTLTGFNISNASPGNSLIFDVSGKGSGNGGLIKVTQLNPDTDINIGKAASQWQFIATNGPTGLSSGIAIVIMANKGSFDGTGKIVVDPSAISLSTSSKTNPNVNGGLIQLSAPTIVAASTIPAKSPLIINASGIGTGSGGSIIFEESNADSNPVIGNKVGQIELLATSGKTGGNGGSVTVIGGNSLTVNPIGLSVKAAGNGNGGRISLTATNPLKTMDGVAGNLLVTAALSANAVGKGTGGSISLNSNSAKTFNVGLVTGNLNGVKGGLSVTGTNSSLNIVANGSTGIGGNAGITIQSILSTPQSVTLNLGSSATGDITINSTVGGTKTNSIVIAPVGTNTGIADNIIGGNTGKLVTSTTGSITLMAKNDIRGLITVSKTATTTKQLQLVTTQLSAETNSGDIVIKDGISRSLIVTVSKMVAGNNLSLSSGGGIHTLNYGNAGAAFLTALNRIDVNANGNLKVAGKGSDMNSSDSARTTSLSPNDEIISNADSNTVHINGLADLKAMPNPDVASQGNLLNVVYAKDNIAVNLSSDTILSGSLGSSTSVTSLTNSAYSASIQGPVVILGKSVMITTSDGNIGGLSLNQRPQIASLNATLKAGSNGDINVSNYLKTTIGIINSFAKSFDVISAGGLTLSNLTSAGTVSVETHGATKLDTIASTDGVSVVAGGSTTVGSISTTSVGGNISIVVSTGVLQTAIGSLITSQNGSITLENANTKSGSIVIASGSDIETGTIPAAGSGGTITITIGNPVAQSGPAPAPTLVAAQELGGTIFWGANSVSASNKTGINHVTAKNADIIFNTGSLKSTAIKLNGDVTIVADPPSPTVSYGALTLESDEAMSRPGAVANFNQSPIKLSASMSRDRLDIEQKNGGSLAKLEYWRNLNPTNASLGQLQGRPISSLLDSTLRPGDISTIPPSTFESTSDLIDAVVVSRQSLGITNIRSCRFEGPTTFEEIDKVTDRLLLSKGSTLILSDKKTILPTPFGTIMLKPQSLVLVLSTEHSLAVFDLDDSTFGSVRVSLGKNTIELSPGQQVTITKNRSPRFEECNLAQILGYRNLKMCAVSEPDKPTLSVFRSEFHLPHTIHAVSGLQNLITSKTKATRKISNHFLKTVGIISEAYSNGETFKQFLLSEFLATSCTHQP